MKPNWPKVLANDDGIRPAGEQDACFYCRSKIGEPHGDECVMVEKLVKVRYTFELEIKIPHHWDAHRFECHRNDGTWCADNAIGELEELKTHDSGCLCNRFTAEFVSVVDETPIQTLKPIEHTK